MSRSLKIAIADDEPEVCRYFAKVLTRCGHQIVVTADNGRDLVDRCRAERPDLIITDIRMEQLNAIEAIEELVRAGLTVPTVLISAHYGPEEFEGRQVGEVLAFLNKPIKSAELEAVVADAAERIP